MLSHILHNLNCCGTNCDSSANEETFIAPSDLQEQKSRMKKAHQPFHPAIQRSGMRFNRKNASFSVSASNGTIKFGRFDGKSSENHASNDKSAKKMLKKIKINREQVDQKEREESKHRQVHEEIKKK